MRKISVILISFLAVACGSKHKDPVSPTVREEALTASTESCKAFVKRFQNDFASVKGAFSDFLTVPEDAANPTGPKIKVFYYGRMVPGRTPVVFFNGGPAGNSHGSYVILTRQQKLDNAWSTIPFIFIDQRGTGCSDAYPQGTDVATLRRLANYGTRGIVNDAEAIRAHLGIKKWKIFGQSYGAFLVHRYAVLAPDSIDAAYAHAGVITTDPMFRLVGRIRAQNRVIETYLTDYPQDRELLTKINAQLTPEVCFGHDGFTFKKCGRDAIAPLLSELGFTDNWLNLHVRFSLLLKNDVLNRERVQELLDRMVFVPAEVGRSSGVASEVIGWNDRNVLDENHDNCQKVYDVLRGQGAKPESFLFNECEAPIQLGRAGQSALALKVRATVPQDLLTMADFKNSLQSHPAMPFFLYSGAKDAYVPVDDFSEELNAVQNLIHYTHFLGTGHDGFYTEPQVWEDLLSVN